MSIFCLLWTPLFYLFWRSISGSRNLFAGVIAIIMGCIAALVQFFLGDFLFPGEFGLSRWLSGCVDLIVLPVLCPVIVYFFLIGCGIVSGLSGFSSFAQLWLIPGALIRAIVWSSNNDPIFLLLIPVLWTTITVGVPFFIGLIPVIRKLLIPLAVLGIFFVPLAAATSYWAFFSHENIIGLLCLLAAAVPMIVSVILTFRQAG